MPGTATVPRLVAARIEATPERAAYFVRSEVERWTPVTWATVGERVARRASGLQRRGVGRGTRLAIVAPTCIEWELTQLAALSLGALVAGIDPQYPRHTMARVLDDVSPQVFVVAGREQLERLPPAATSRADLLLTLDADGSKGLVPTAQLEALATPGVMTSGVRPEDPAVVAFSSGTTGTPKAIVYTHEQVILAVDTITSMFPELGVESVLVAWLPLANLFQRIMNLCAVEFGATTYLVEDPRQISRCLSEVEPHMVIGVPRFLEKFHQAVTEKLALRPLAGRAVALALEGNRQRREGGGSPLRLASPILNRMALAPLRNALGSRCRFVVSGSAPVPAALLDWYENLGVPVLEAYGVSENIVPIALNRLTDRRAGTVGKPLAPNTVTLSPDGEILVAGAGVHALRLEAGRIVAARPGNEGKLATGDLGAFDADGYLRIVGRKQDTFKLSSGRWIRPDEVEAALARVPYIDQAAVFGENSKATVAVVSLRPGPDSPSSKRLAEAVRGAVETLPSFARPAVIVVASDGFSVEGGDLTVNMKIRRAAIRDRFAASLMKARQAIAEGDAPLVQYA